MDGTGKIKINIDTVVAGGKYCFEVESTTCAFGVDDSGEIIIARRDVSDSDIPQFVDINEPGYVLVWSGSQACLKTKYNPVVI